MALFELTVSPEGNVGSVSLNSPEAPMPFTIHVFGAERVQAWNSATDQQRALEAGTIVQNLFLLAMRFNLTDGETASLYNRGCALQGIDDHAVEYEGGGFDTRD